MMNNQCIIRYIREAVERKYNSDNDLTRPDWNSVTMFIDGLEEFVGNIVEMPDIYRFNDFIERTWRNK